MNELELTGRARTHIVDLEQFKCGLHYETVVSFLAMRDAAREDGIDLGIRSAYRDFDTQLLIWNRKWSGERPIYDRAGEPVDRAQLNEFDLVETILFWSAVPGGSRHHWGTDLDLIDVAAIPPGYTVQLLPAEFAPEGIFGKLNRWLEAHLGRFGFFRPYRSDRGGVSPEPWHVSYAPVSMPALEALNLATLRRVLESSSLQGKAQDEAALPEIYTRFLLAIDAPE